MLCFIVALANMPIADITALGQIAPLALRYGATDYRVYRAREDRYKFTQMATFEDKLDFDRYWYGVDFSAWRATLPDALRALFPL